MNSANHTGIYPRQINAATETKPPATVNLIAHDLDSAPSQSGAPMWISKDTRRLVAIHAGTVGGGTMRKAIVLNNAVRTQLRDWMTRTLPPILR